MRTVLLLSLMLSACATVDDAPLAAPSSASPLQPPAQPSPQPSPGNDEAIDIGALQVPTTLKPPPPLATIPACGVDVQLARHAPILFEGDIIDELREVELDLIGPARLTVVAEGADFSAVALRPQIALRLPAGPATDAPAGSSGALFDVVGLVVAGFVNLMLLPVSVPVGLLTNNDLFVLDVPSFRDGMFSDVVLEETLWQSEVERRAAPHAARLKREAERQARFAPVLQKLQQQARAAPGCVLDDTGHCRLRFTWPNRFVTLTASGLPCTTPPPVNSHRSDDNDNDNDNDNDDEDNSDDDQPVPLAPQVTLALPLVPSSPAPTMLPLPPNPDEHRGRGAERTASHWTSAWDVRVQRAAAVYDAATLRGAKNAALDDVDLVCRVKTRGNDFDVDGSAPELSIRLAWGFDQDVVGATFPTTEARTTTFGVHHASLQPGEAVKISVVDVDAFVDDWVGMDIAIFDGRLPLRFSHLQFSAECRAARATSPSLSSSSSSSPRAVQPQQEQQPGLDL